MQALLALVKEAVKAAVTDTDGTSLVPAGELFEVLHRDRLDHEALNLLHIVHDALSTNAHINSFCRFFMVRTYGAAAALSCGMFIVVAPRNLLA